MANSAAHSGIPILAVTDRWEELLRQEARSALERFLPNVLKSKRWFGGKARAISSTHIRDVVTVPYNAVRAELLFIEVHYVAGGSEVYLLPVAFAAGSEAERILHEVPHTVVAHVQAHKQGDGQHGLLYDALWNSDFACTLLNTVREEGSYEGLSGHVTASRTNAYETLVGKETRLPTFVMKAEQSNTSVVFGDRLVLKLYRRLGDGINPDLEIGRLLTDLGFPAVPAVAGALEYCVKGGEPATLAILQSFARNQGDAWSQALQSLQVYFDKVREVHPGRSEAPASSAPVLVLAAEDIPVLARTLIGTYLDSAQRIAQRTAELHLALAQCRDNPNFTPEPFSPAYRRDRYESMCQITEHNFDRLKEALPGLPKDAVEQAHRVLDERPMILNRFQEFKELHTTALRTRCHGDYHLGQVLCVGEDFMIIDFEGEPARPLSERRAKHSPALDVAGMLRSFHYAPYAVLYERQAAATGQTQSSLTELGAWAEYWYRWVSASFLNRYLSVVSRVSFWPQSPNEVRVLLDAHLLEKAVYELGYELNNRPTWLRIPLEGVLQLMEDAH